MLVVGSVVGALAQWFGTAPLLALLGMTGLAAAVCAQGLPEVE